MPSGVATPIQTCLDALRAGDPSARAELLRVSQERILLMTRKMLRRYPRVRRWEESDDVLQNVLVRLHRTLEKVPLDSPRHFLALAAVHVRREMIDLARHYFGPQGIAAHHASPGGARVDAVAPDQATVPPVEDPASQSSWAALHEQIAALPDEEREAVELLWYHGMSQQEAAMLLGISVRTVRRRWQAARIQLGAALRDDPPL
jgi:RNA polymerase sigma-70 factor (ECF subfamily)